MVWKAFLILFGSALVVILCVLVYRIIRAFFYDFTPLKKKYITILEAKFYYYKLLNEEQKRKFQRKLKYFMQSKNFISRRDITITDEMKVLLSASAAQLTFGIQDLKFTHFSEILIFPRRYRNQKTGLMHVGEVNSRGIIAFSWEDVLKSYSNPHDGRNLPLHEMAHALRLEDLISNNEYLFLKERYINSFDRQAKIIAEEVKSGENGFLRKYAAANKDEFFAVAIESFFERAVEFREQMPDLYKTLTKLLNQDPAKLELSYQRSIDKEE